jgi:superfamily II DNA or RNA helicase
MVEVDFGPNEKQYKRYDLLEPVRAESDLFDLLRSGAFGGPSDLRRVLTFEKVKGDLTNVFYSMEASNTDFYPHQFKPVMRFIESPVGRMLIADEVGLGKTIEAAYIWKEIQARHSARRLLIVCPAMLREKWRTDLRQRFNLVADIVSVRELHDRVSEMTNRAATQSFAYITSLEGLRPPTNFDDEGIQSARAKFARLLDQNVATDDLALFDYVVIDEAHYLRNPSTGNNRVGRLLREASKHLVLLTATPIQIGSDNLYQLLRLIDPDQFYDALLFRDMLHANGCIVRAQRALWSQPADPVSALTAIEEAEKSDYFKSDAVIDRIKIHLRASKLDAERRVEVLRLLEMRSLLSQYMTRSRKREVLPNRVERKAQTLSVAFSPAEAAIYNHVTERIRNQSVGVSGVSLFSLIARQRQMASSIVGALESWRDRDLLDELLWEDMGQPGGAVDRDDDGGTAIGERSIPVAFGYAFDIAELERTDAKYEALITFLRGELARNPREKFVLFAFYRGTLKYLARRLRADGITAGVIMGDMGDSKDLILEQFRRPDGPSVLLSSEVGSEGIDLQFCRFLVNYDLPWNPMRVEQRIGRLDRLGQRAERISIINLAVSNTIEDRILMRLYDRINVFRESIGDLEEILGETTEKLMIALLDPNLTDDERERQSAVAELAIQNTQEQQRELEQEAVNLVGFSDYILDHINESRDRGRWLSAAELVTLVEDFFARKYPGTKAEGVAGEQFLLRLSLSEEARRDLAYFIEDLKPSTRTRLHQSSRPVPCNFDPRNTQAKSPDTELIEPGHPLILWIRNNYEADQSQLYRVAAVKLGTQQAGVPIGDYAFCAQRWSFKGVREDQLLAFSAAGVRGGEPLSGAQSEELVTRAARFGDVFPNAENLVDSMEGVGAAAFECEQQLNDAFAARLSDFEAENTLRCNQQEVSATKFAERRLAELQQRLSRYRAADNLRPVAMTEGLVRREEEQLRLKLDRVSRRRQVDPTLSLLGVGVIRVQ